MLRSPLNRSGSLSPKRTRKCAVKGCANRFQPRNMGHKVCGPECAAVHAVAERKRLDAKQTRERKQAMKRKGDYLSEAQAAFNAFIRYRDRDQACICCGKTDAAGHGGVGGGWDAGHWISRGHASHLRFNEANVHKQRKGCNRPGGTTRAKYRVGLVARIGEDAVLELESLEYAPTQKRWTIDELVEITKTYRAKLRALKEAANGNLHI